ncbi:hypothetical protein diail_7113 [Diaporthe ilicicola]|nr:hypothetical protein diail_7113 [Diaporthe ilicicola]
MNGVHCLAGWQWPFISAGAITVGQGLLGFLTIPDSPANTRAIWLTTAEKRLAQLRMGESIINTTVRIPASVLKKKLRHIIVHPITYFFFLFAFALTAWSHRANSYFVLYVPREPRLRHLPREYHHPRGLRAADRHEPRLQLSFGLEALALADQHRVGVRGILMLLTVALRSILAGALRFRLMRRNLRIERSRYEGM